MLYTLCISFIDICVSLNIAYIKVASHCSRNEPALLRAKSIMREFMSLALLLFWLPKLPIFVLNSKKLMILFPKLYLIRSP